MATELLSCDERGRVVLPQDVREQYGGVFHLVRARDEVILIPASKEPLRELAELGRRAGITRHSIKRLKGAIKEQAEKEV